MPLFELLIVALDAIVMNKLRSLLTILGVVIGIAAVIAMMALGEGAQRAVADRLRGLGTNILTVRPGQSFFGGVGQGQARLTTRDAEALARTPAAIGAVSPEMEGRFQVELGGENANLSVVGAWPAYFDVNGFELEAGRLFTEADDRARRRVAVLGALVGAQLGAGDGGHGLVGRTVRIRGVPFQVIGVLSERGAQGFANPDESLFIPLATAQFRILGDDRVRSISVQARSEDQMDAALAEIDANLRRVRRLDPAEPADFNVRDQASLWSAMQETTRTLSFLLAGIATISLIVGGIGIMNIMLVSVTERTREIGLRKALGARSRDILGQFLIESLVLCLLGGGLGVAIGLLGSLVLERLAGWTVAVAPAAILLAFSFSAAVGLFFGLWPARRAARLSPIEALRYE